MRATRRLLLALAMSGAVVPARAADPAPEPAPAGTEAGAGDLTNALAAYVGRTAIDMSVLKIASDPAGYRVTVDLSKILPTVLPPEAKVEIAPYDLIVSPRQDGNWNVFLGSMPSISYSIKTADAMQSGAYTQENGSFKGVYAPEIAAFLSGQGSVAKLRATTTDPLGESESEFGPSSFELKGTKVENGGADIELRQVIDGFSERREFTDPNLPKEVATPIVAKGGRLETVLSAKAMRSRAVADLQAFLIAHPVLIAPQTDPSALAGLEGEFKTHLRAVLPLWQNLGISAKADGLSGEAGFGTFTARSLGYDFSMDGLSKDAKMAGGVSLGGLDIVSPLIPTWTKVLIPQDVDLHFGVEKLDLATPVAIAIDDFSLTGPADQFDEIGRKAGEAFDASPPSITIEPSRIRTAGLDLSFNGALIISEAKPAASFSIEAKGLDQTIETLKAAAEKAPDANQVIGMLSIAKGFGKALADGEMQWVVNAEPDGSVKVNGVQIKGPDPVAGDDGSADDDSPDEGIAPDGEVPLDQAPTDDNALPDAPPKP